MAVRIIASIISHCSICILLVVFFTSAGLIGWVLFKEGIPDFSQPAKGFETRGTTISDRSYTFQAMELEVGKEENGSFTSIPWKLIDSSIPKTTNETSEALITDDGSLLDELNLTTTPAPHEILPPKFCPEKIKSRRPGVLVLEVGPYESPEFIKSLCRFEHKLESLGVLHNYPYCFTDIVNSTASCCTPWHIASYVAHFHGAHNCSAFDADSFWPSYWSKIYDCTLNNRTVNLGDPLCQQIDLVYEYFLPKDFPHFKAESANLTTMMLPYGHYEFIQMLENSDTGFTYELLDSFIEKTHVPGAKVVAMHLDINFFLFNYHLKQDTMYTALGLLLVFLCMWLYTASLLFTMATVTAIVFSAGLSYFFYQIVFQMPFFPFMNLLTLVLLIGIGADDAFIFRQAWLHSKLISHPDCLTEVLHNTLVHACLSMLVTSLTTAAAFFANLVNSVIVVKCFALFAGTTILVNYIFVISWLPASMVLIERFDRWSKLSERCKFCTTVYTKLYDCGGILFEKVLPVIVTKLSYIWLILFTGVTCFMVFTVFYSPGLHLPDKEEFAFFRPDHPFEQFASNLSKRFTFSSKEDQTNNYFTIVWGFYSSSPTLFDPDKEGAAVMWPKEKFTFAQSQNLLWLRDLCDKISQANFTLMVTPLSESCFMRDFMLMMQRNCTDISGKDMRPCCEENPFPYQISVAETCIGQYAFENRYDLDKPWKYKSLSPGPLFLNTNESNRFVGLTVSFSSTYSFTQSYGSMDEYYKTISNFIEKELADGPIGVRDGWLTSDLLFYDVQQTLVYGTVSAVLISLPIAYLVLFVATQNLLISFLAILSITGVIITTVGILVLMEWQLNVLESAIIIIAIGLSFDFTLHYAVTYKLCKETDKEERAIYALKRVGSAIFTACMTTFLAGAAMIFTSTLAFFQIGFFLMLLSCVSWLYSTFFYCSLLHRFGPSDHSCQLRLKKKEEEKGEEMSDYLHHHQYSPLGTSTDRFLDAEHIALT